ncbi:MAG: ankyrin repeat and protein mask, partial [Chthonomonadaceae bacterium]|nr:ankyrin repeat and protein mask [Chthonomonadaceae bacterium]
MIDPAYTRVSVPLSGRSGNGSTQRQQTADRKTVLLTFSALCLCVLACSRCSEGVPLGRKHAFRSCQGAAKESASQVAKPLVAGNPPLIDAVNANDLERAKHLIAQGVNVNAEDNDGNTALLLLLMRYRSDHLPMLKLLMRSGADINVHGKYGIPPWHHLYMQGFGSVEPGYTSQDTLAVGHRMEVLQALLDTGLDLKKNGRAMLESAAFYGDLAIIKWLIAHGVDFHRYGPKTLRAAAFWNQDYPFEPSHAAIGFLIRQGAYRPDDPDCRATFINIAWCGQLEFTRDLLALGAGRHRRHRRDLGQALIGASGGYSTRQGSWGNVKVVDLLIRHGAALNARHGDSGPPLLCAMRLGTEGHEIARLLLKRGADANARSAGGYTALMSAVATDDIDTVKLLLRYGANPNAKSAEEQTP